MAVRLQLGMVVNSGVSGALPRAIGDWSPIRAAEQFGALDDLPQSGDRSLTTGTITKATAIIAGVGRDSSHPIADPMTAGCRRPGCRCRRPHRSGSSVETPSRSLLDGPCPVRFPHGDGTGL